MIVCVEQTTRITALRCLLGRRGMGQQGDQALVHVGRGMQKPLFFSFAAHTHGCFSIVSGFPSSRKVHIADRVVSTPIYILLCFLFQQV